MNAGAALPLRIRLRPPDDLRGGHTHRLREPKTGSPAGASGKLADEHSDGQAGSLLLWGQKHQRAVPAE